MAIKERYRDNIGYWYPQPPHINGEKPKWVTEGIPFRFNDMGEMNDYQQNQAGVIQNTKVATWKTDTQKEFRVGDRVTREKIPMQNAERKDYSIIVKAPKKPIPINEKGNRYRTKQIKSTDLIIS